MFAPPKPIAAPYLLIPAGMLLLALMPLPYGYYLLLRLVVCIAAGMVAFFAFSSVPRIHWRIVTFGMIALLFNPFVRIHLTRELWAPIDVIVAILFLIIAMRGLEPHRAR